MSTDEHRTLQRPSVQLLTDKQVLSGLMFMGVAIFGLWVSRDYPIGTTLRMGTGYVPRFLCWALLGLGCLVLAQGLIALRSAAQPAEPVGWAWRAPLFVTASLVVFGLTLETLGLVISIFLLTVVGALASPALRWFETIVAALVLVAVSWAIFVIGLGVTIPVWPEF